MLLKVVEERQQLQRWGKNDEQGTRNGEGCLIADVVGSLIWEFECLKWLKMVQFKDPSPQQVGDGMTEVRGWFLISLA